MKTHKLDIETSKIVYAENKANIHLKDCYRNIYNLVFRNLERFQSGEWKIAYGYMPCLGGELYVRHCFIVDKDGNAIDPTAERIKNETVNFIYPQADYLSFAILDYDEYVKLIEENDYYIDLCKVLQEKENALRKESNLILIG